MEEKDFDNLKLPELKEELGKLNLPITGTKETLLQRLKEASPKTPSGLQNDEESESEEQEIPEDITKMKVQELKEALKKRSLSCTGTKTVLVERLSSAINGGEKEEKASGKRKASSKAGGGALKKRKVSSTKKNEESNDSEESNEGSSEEEELGEKEKDKKAKKNTPNSKTDSGADDFSQPVLSGDEIRIATWNVAGFNAILKKGFATFLKNENPDILCLNETKIKSDNGNQFPGYHSYFYACDSNAGYSGVGLLSKIKPLSIQKGIGNKEHDTEGRCITAEYENFYVVATYIPNAGAKAKGGGGMPKDLDYRMQWDTAFQGYLHELDKKKPIIWCGDLNVAHKEIDLANPKSNTKTAGFTPQERESFSKFLNTGFVDVHRHFNPNKEKCFSFWTYRGGAREKNVGWRLDYFVVSQRLLPRVTQSYLRRYVQGSDHCPIGIHLKKDTEE